MHETKRSGAERIDIGHDYAVCAWARHFNVSQDSVKKAVAAVGENADKVREHLGAARAGKTAGQDRPSGR